MSENIHIRSQEKTVSSDGRVALGKQVPVSQRSGEESSRPLSPWKGTSEGQARAGLLEATANMGKCAWGWKRQGARPLGGPLTSLGDFWLAARRGCWESGEPTHCHLLPGQDSWWPGGWHRASRGWAGALCHPATQMLGVCTPGKVAEAEIAVAGGNYSGAPLCRCI